MPLVLGGELRGAAVCWGNVESVETAETFDHLASALVLGLERLELAEVLRRSERRFRSLVQNASDVVTIVDVDSIHYQPIFELGSEEVLGFEAVVRWWHPQWGLVQPDEFIEAAEENGLIVPLGSFVLTEAIRQAADWQRRFARERPLRVRSWRSSTRAPRTRRSPGRSSSWPRRCA